MWRLLGSDEAFGLGGLGGLCHIPATIELSGVLGQPGLAALARSAARAWSSHDAILLGHGLTPGLCDVNGFGGGAGLVQHVLYETLVQIEDDKAPDCTMSRTSGSAEVDIVVILRHQIDLWSKHWDGYHGNGRRVSFARDRVGS